MDDNFFWFSVIAGALILFIVGIIKSKRPEQRRYTECEDKNCVRCQKYIAIQTEAILRYQEYTKRIDPDKISKRLQISIKDLYNPKVHKRQNPNVFFMHGLNSHPWPMTVLMKNVCAIELDIAVVEQNVKQIHLELVDVLTNHYDKWLINNTPTGCWKVFHLINQGQVVDRNISLAPRTFEIVSRLRSVMLCNVFGNVAFSVIYPRTVISEHFGPTNTRLRCHLGLVTSKFCSITVDGTTRSWEYGKSLVFDDSYLHGVEFMDNSDDQMRAILMIDLWHPDITQDEKEVLSFIFDNK